MGRRRGLFLRDRIVSTLLMGYNKNQINTERESEIGENIAYGQNSPEDVMNSWMNSSGHRANILNAEFEEIGVGCYVKGSRKYWVQLFGTQR